MISLWHIGYNVIIKQLTGRISQQPKQHHPTTFALAQRHERRGGKAIDNSYLAFARTITRRARVRQLTMEI